jgi:hypothetical protein
MGLATIIVIAAAFVSLNFYSIFGESNNQA